MHEHDVTTLALDAEAAPPGTVLDRVFLAEHTVGFDAPEPSASRDRRPASPPRVRVASRAWT